MSPGTVGHIPSGWYPDPDQCHAPAGRQRYWDGSAWTSAWTERTTAPIVPTTVQPTMAGPAPIPARRTNVAAVVSLIFGILWLCYVGSLVAVIAGHTARKQIRRTGEAGDGAAIA